MKQLLTALLTTVVLAGCLPTVHSGARLVLERSGPEVVATVSAGQLAAFDVVLVINADPRARTDDPRCYVLRTAVLACRLGNLAAGTETSVTVTASSVLANVSFYRPGALVPTFIDATVMP